MLVTMQLDVRARPSYGTHFISRAVLRMAFWLLKTRSTSWRRIVSVSIACPGTCPAAVTGTWYCFTVYVVHIVGFIIRKITIGY